MRTHLVIAVLVAFVLGIYPLTGCAQDPAAGGQAADSALTRGDYQDARSLYQSLLDGTNGRTPERVTWRRPAPTNGKAQGSQWILAPSFSSSCACSSCLTAATPSAVSQ